MDVVLQVFVLVASLAFLSKFSHLTITSLVKISKITKIEEVSVGFVILSLTTSLPELMISGISAMYGDVGIAVGNVFGSNIANVCLILGISAVMFSLSITERNLRKILNILSLSSLITIVLINIKDGTHYMAPILLTTFFVFAAYSTKKKISIERLKTKPRTELERALIPVKLYKSILFFFIGIVGIYVSSHFVVTSGSFIARHLNIPETVIGATIIAFGTSLPELSTTLTAIKERHINLAMGNVIGSCLTNLTLVLGVTLFLSPLRVDMTIFSTIVMFALGSTILLEFFLGSMGRGKLDRMEGVILTILYIFFLITTFSVEMTLMK